LPNACCRCTTFQIKNNSPNPELAIFGERFETFEFGLFFIQKYELVGTINQELVFVDSCINYPDEIYDTSIVDIKWQAAIVLQIVSWAIGLILIINLFASVCVPYSPHTFRLIGLGFVLISCLFEGLIFLVFDSILCSDNPVLDFLGVEENYQTECKLGNGSSMVFISTFGYFITGLGCCGLGGQKGGTKDEMVSAKPDVQSVKVEETGLDETVLEEGAAETGGDEPGAFEENADTDAVRVYSSRDADIAWIYGDDEQSQSSYGHGSYNKDADSLSENVEVTEDEFSSSNMEEKLYHGWR
jgi:hypothetical protein